MNVLITGASSGIGKACAQAFAKAGCDLYLSSRTLSKVQEVADVLSAQFGISAHAAALDVRDSSAVAEYCRDLPAIDVLINNAGLASGFSRIYENTLDEWNEMIDTNVKGLLYMTKGLLPKMRRENKGTIINIGSIAGIAAYPNGAVYCGSKAAVKSITDGIRQDLVDTNIRVANIQPGFVETNFSVVRFHGDSERAAKVYEGMEVLSAADIADAAIYIAKAPPHVQICEITITPTCQATGGVFHRNQS